MKEQDYFKALNELNEIIFITSLDTNEIIFSNKNAVRLFGQIYDTSGKRKNCYDYIKQPKDSLSFCSNKELLQCKSRVQIQNYPKLHHQYMLHDSIIQINGIDYRMSLAVDLSNSIGYETDEHHQTFIGKQLEQCIWEIARSDDFTSAVHSVLHKIMNYYHGERVYTFDFDWFHNTFSNTFEICADGISKQIDSLQDIPIEKAQFWMKHFHNNGKVVIDDVSSIATDSKRKAEYEILSRQGIHSLIAVPVFFDNVLQGFLGVDNPKRNFQELSFIHTLSFLIATESQKNNNKQTMKMLNYLDPLTGVYNQTGWDRIKQDLIDYNGFLAMMLFDIDNFKKIRYQYGEITSNEVLIHIGNTLRSIFRSDDKIIRYGEDEFLVLLMNYPIELSPILIQKIKQIKEQLSDKNYTLPKISLSTGIAFSQKEDLDSLYKKADRALYYAKQTPQMHYHIYEDPTEIE